MDNLDQQLAELARISRSELRPSNMNTNDPNQTPVRSAGPSAAAGPGSGYTSPISGGSSTLGRKVGPAVPPKPKKQPPQAQYQHQRQPPSSPQPQQTSASSTTSTPAPSIQGMQQQQQHNINQQHQQLYSNMPPPPLPPSSPPGQSGQPSVDHAIRQHQHLYANTSSSSSPTGAGHYATAGSTARQENRRQHETMSSPQHEYANVQQYRQQNHPQQQQQYSPQKPQQQQQQHTPQQQQQHNTSYAGMQIHHQQQQAISSPSDFIQPPPQHQMPQITQQQQQQQQQQQEPQQQETIAYTLKPADYNLVVTNLREQIRNVIGAAGTTQAAAGGGGVGSVSGHPEGLIYSNLRYPPAKTGGSVGPESMSSPSSRDHRGDHHHGGGNVPLYSNLPAMPPPTRMPYLNGDELPPPPPPLDMTSNAIGGPVSAGHYATCNATTNMQLPPPPPEDLLPLPPPSPVSSSYSELRRATQGGGGGGGGGVGGGSVSSNSTTAHPDFGGEGVGVGGTAGGGGSSGSTYGGMGSQTSSTYESIYEPINPRPPSQMSSRSNYSLYAPYGGGSNSSTMTGPSTSASRIGMHPHAGLMPNSSSPNNNRDSSKEREIDSLTDLLVQNMGLNNNHGGGGGSGGRPANHDGNLEEDEDGDSNATDDSYCYGRCAKCRKRVVGYNSGCTAMDRLYHTKCFTCHQCAVELQGKPFYAHKGMPHCEEDFLNTLEKCSVCLKPITDRILRATGKPYHPQCFTCVVCHVCLDGTPFTVDAANRVHCIEDFHKNFAPRCWVCKEPIVPEPGQLETVRVVALDHSFHIKCYKCEDCGLGLSSETEGRGCYPLDGHVLCKDCNARRVQRLTESITTEL